MLTAIDGFIGLRYSTSGLEKHQAYGCFLIRGFTVTWPSFWATLPRPRAFVVG